MQTQTFVLLAHQPSKETVEFIQSIEPGAVFYQYQFHASRQTGISKSVIGLIMEIERDLMLQTAKRILISPPGLSNASFLMIPAIEGICGVRPELLNLIRQPDGTYVPAPEMPIVSAKELYNYLRKQRSRGIINFSAREEAKEVAPT